MSAKIYYPNVLRISAFQRLLFMSLKLVLLSPYLLKKELSIKRNSPFLNVITFGEEEAKVSANIRVDLERKGRPIGASDILIGGIALGYQAILINA